MLATKERITAERSISTERYILSTNPVLYMPLWKTDGSPFISSDGRGFQATVTGATWGIQGRTFDGIDDHIQIPTFNLTGNYTYELWFKRLTDSGDTERILSKSSDASYKHYLHIIATDVLQVGHTSAVDEMYLTGLTPIAINTWYHVASTWQSGGIDFTILINGNQDATGITAGTSGNIQANSDLVWELGKLLTLYAFNGIIGEVRIYNRALSSVEIQHNYLATRWRYQ